MKKILEIKGYVCKHADDVYLEDEPKDEDYYYPKNDSVGSIVADHFSKLVKGFQVSPDDWTRGTIQMVGEVFCQYYVTDKPKEWEEATEDDLKKMAGALQTENRYGGYSEYTITDSWTEIFVGGHDLREELKSHDGKYAIIRINYKI